MFKNYFAPTPKTFRIIGDLCLVLIPVMQGTIASAPNLSSVSKYWLSSVFTIVLVLAKFSTNLFKDKEESK